MPCASSCALLYSGTTDNHQTVILDTSYNGEVVSEVHSLKLSASSQSSTELALLSDTNCPLHSVHHMNFQTNLLDFFDRTSDLSCLKAVNHATILLIFVRDKHA